MNASDVFFPHDEVRPIQDKLVNDVVTAINTGTHLIAHAPTGLGKTSAALSPALTFALDKDYTIFFLTPKHTQHQIAIETLKQIKQKYNLDFIAIDFIGKKHMCMQRIAAKFSGNEFMEYCKDLREEDSCQFYSNIIREKSQITGKATQVLASIAKKLPMHVEELMRESQSAELCPYEVSSLLSKKAKVIIADYYHIFSPRIQKAFLKRLGRSLDKSILIIDEGHNLPGRIRSLLTNKLTTIGLSFASKEARRYHFSELASALSNLRGALSELAHKKLDSVTFKKDENEAHITKEDFEELVKNIGWNYDELFVELEHTAEYVRKQSHRSVCGGIASFFESWQGDEDGFVRFLRRGRTKEGKTNIELNYSCLSPDMISKEIIEETRSTILMSGTLTPTFMYRDLLGFDKGMTIEKEYSSPFPPENRQSFIIPDVTTKFTERCEAEYQKLGKECADIVNVVPHNSAVFFPSYFLMGQILPFFTSLCKKKTFIEKPDMIKEEKAQLLKKFKESSRDGAVLLGVTSGSFGEGIDLPGDFLQCVVVVGVPLAKPDLEMQALIDYYQKRFGKGWDYGYVFPAMSKVLQAAGRCIRSKDDRGVIVFMDKRFAWDNYARCISKEWRPITTKLVSVRVERFFNK